MTKLSKITTTFALIAGLAAPALAQDAKMIENAIGARKAQMQLYGFNLGILGGMAKGDIAYDATVAQGAADSLAALTRLDASQMWPAGSDSGSASGTRAKAEMWGDMPGVIEKAMAMQAAADAMVAAAGQGQAAIGGAIGGVGGACGACHKAYRGPRN